MKIPTFAATLLLSASLAIQAWTLSEIVALKVNVARLQSQMESHMASVHPK